VATGHKAVVLTLTEATTIIIIIIIFATVAKAAENTNRESMMRIKTPYRNGHNCIKIRSTKHDDEAACEDEEMNRRNEYMSDLNTHENERKVKKTKSTLEKS
jgi:hypothetical protein